MIPSEEARHPSIQQLAACDEILQVMYWLRGEGLAAVVAASDLSRWIGLPGEAIGSLLQRLAATGLVERVEEPVADRTPRYALSALGVREGGRRFADEFASMTRSAHGECRDPNCECQRTGNPADCAHRHAPEVAHE